MTAVGREVDASGRITRRLKSEARQLGFDLVGVAAAVRPDGFDEFREWLHRGFAGAMEYLPRREPAYEHPRHVLEGVRSVVMLAVNYRTAELPLSGPNQGLVSRYAWGDGDYHDVIREKLRKLAEFLHELCPTCRTRGVVDTAPLLERDFARLAGLGWIGKNTLLLNKQAGSWLFLAALLTDVELQPDAPHETAHCGTCTRCLEACPTDAFPEPYVLDARRCISYLTIELRDRPIPVELRDGMGAWLFGCDICQEVCPWNRKAPRTDEPPFVPRDDLHPADAIELLGISQEEFRRRFARMPLARPGRAGLLRNAAIVLGNTGDGRAVPALCAALNDEEPLVRGATAWALGKLGGDAAVAALEARMAVEDDAGVRGEIEAALYTLSYGQRASGGPGR